MGAGAEEANTWITAEELHSIGNELQTLSVGVELLCLEAQRGLNGTDTQQLINDAIDNLTKIQSMLRERQGQAG